MEGQERFSLGNLLGGGAIERFDDELKRVIENILDPNTDNGARTITLKVKLTPTEDRSRADISVACHSSVVGAKPCTTLVYLGKDRGEAVAYEYNPEQLRLNLAKKTPVVGLKPASDGKEK